MRIILTIGIIFLFCNVEAQQSIIYGHIMDKQQNPIEGVNIAIGNSGTYSGPTGNFSIHVPSNRYYVIHYSHLNFIPRRDSIFIAGDSVRIDIILQEDITMLSEVSIEEDRNRENISTIELKPKEFTEFPTTTPDISRILISLPGVISNNELSTSYSVRGGNFDENLIYVEGIPIYKPQIASSGQQEGLGFVNLGMVESVHFSSGGWDGRYGDKLSSVLNIKYKKPEEFNAEIIGSLLGGSITLGTTINNKTTILAGVRHKNTRYLLNSLETEGEYLPKFTDVQIFSTTKFSDQLTLSFLGSFASNNYEIIPATRETEFGTFNQAYRLKVGFEGRDLLTYKTYQGGVKAEQKWNSAFSSTLILSAVKTLETEYTDVEGGYRLCDVNKNIGSSSFNECNLILGIGTLYDNRRNYLNGHQVSIDLKNSYELNDGSNLTAGIRWNFEQFEERVSEYSFTDSVDYITELNALDAEVSLQTSPITGFLNWNKDIDKHSLSIGSRIIYRDINKEVSIDPRIRYSFSPSKKSDVIYKVAAGFYRQIPVYREFRTRSGKINTDVKMQSSFHFIIGRDEDLRIWNRPFKLTSEAYYKYLWNVNPYEVDNVRIRYFGTNNAKAYAAGADFRLSGEFIKDTESWFSLGLLSTKEDVEEDKKGYFRRPTDQHLTLAIFFQDHIPNNPTFRVNIHIQVGSGLPFGPPEDLQNRNIFNGDTYRRVDIGFSKVFTTWKGIDEFFVVAEILNLTGSRNVISYTWIEDVYDQQFAVPNTLSARFLNLKVGVKI